MNNWCSCTEPPKKFKHGHMVSDPVWLSFNNRNLKGEVVYLEGDDTVIVFNEELGTVRFTATPEGVLTATLSIRL